MEFYNIFMQSSETNGGEYEPDSLRVMQAALHPYLIKKKS